MNLTALQTFLAIDQTGSLVRASEQLNVTQSTVTARLKSLELELGQSLFERNKSGATLTREGQKLKRYAETMVNLWQQARQEVSLPKGITASCTFACHLDLWPHKGRDMLTKLWQARQDVAFSALQATGSELEEMLETGRADLAISYEVPAVPGLEWRRIASERLVVVGDRPDRPTRFDTGYVYVDYGEVFGKRHTAAYADAGLARMTFATALWARDHLLKEGGSAYLPEVLAAPYLDSKELFRLSDAPVFERPVYIVWRTEAVAGWEWFEEWVKAV